MPIIKKPAPPPEIVTREVHLEIPLLATLDSYASFIDSTADHVIASALRLVFKKDHDFRRWLRAQKSPPGSGPEPTTQTATPPESHPKTKKA
jgi:hypothetical protein